MPLIRFCLFFLSALPTFAALPEIYHQLDNTEWVGKAGMYVNGKHYGLDAKMTFKVHNGELYYLSAISKFLDQKIEEKAHGLCINSPPRMAKIQLADDGQSYQGLVVLPELIISEAGQKTFKQYSIPIKELKITGNKLELTSIPLENKGINHNVKYVLYRNNNDEALDQLSYKLHDCLENETWKK